MATNTYTTGKSLPHIFWKRATLYPQQRAFLVKKEREYQPIHWEEVFHSVQIGFLKLKQLGVQPGDRVCIASQSSPEWFMADMSILSLGAVSVPIYHSSIESEIAEIIKNCDPRVLLAENEAQHLKLQGALELCGKNIPIVRLEALFKSDGVVLDIKEYETHVLGIEPNQMASIVYTSGTTGVPKGVVLTHHNFVHVLSQAIDILEVGDKDITMTFLPFAHVLGRVESLVPIFTGLTLGFAENVNTVSANINEVKPTILVSVPRIYEKIYAKIISEVQNGPPAKRKIFDWAVKVGKQASQLRSEKKGLPPALWAQLQLADKLVFEKIRAKLGGRLRISLSGGAPIGKELIQFFHACGIMILEGYGLTETTAPVFVNRPDSYEFGTVGKPLNGTLLKIAEDGEILLKGPMLFKEYFRFAEATNEVMTEEGWFRSGDIGEMTPRGHLKITDRKKELIVTSGGKNVAPQKIENILKASRFISNAMVYGDKQKYLVALLTLNEGEIKKVAPGEIGEGKNYRDLIESDPIQSLIDKELKQVNQQLASYESIKRFKILPEDFSIERGELTPSLKVKRKVITQKYKQEIDALY